MSEKTKVVKIVDKLIFVFIIIFLLSLTNSIFVNQIGYYIALLLLLFKFVITKENPFQKSGLEAAFIWYLSAEIISTVLSNSQALSFHNLLKHALLIPIVFTTISVIPNIDRAKTYFKIYIGAALVTVVIYLIYSYKYYIFNLYSIEQSGPSLFQYPITASEITSFTVLFLFAFLVNEKTTLKNKIFLLIGFAISLLALFATYKRTGWMGTAFGIFLILIIKKQWKILIPVIVLGIAVMFMQKNISQVKIYNYNAGQLKLQESFDTDGRAYHILPDDSVFYVSDFENGLVKYNNSNLSDKYNFPAPIISLNKINSDYYLARLVDTRFILLKKEDQKFIKINEFVSAGFTVDFKIYGNNIYILDSDSGLTVFNLFKTEEPLYRNSMFGRATKFYVDSNYIVGFSPPKNIIIYSVENNLPTEKILNFNNKIDIDFIFYKDKKLFISDKEGLRLYSVENKSLKFVDKNENIKKLYNWNFNDNKLFAAGSNGEIYQFEYPIKDKINIVDKINLGFAPTSIVINGQNIYTTFVKRSRLLSIFDPYLPSNTVRFKLWEAGWNMFLDHPLFGVGDIDLQNLYKEYKNYYDKEIQGHMHNN
ncbi:MAG: O-antigen ligase family protein, partial [Bacteroidetes bacterium]|nr:O-antigen ligase family protein [Bacteroidota bacterium]